MTLKKICEALGWKRIRRWKDFVKEVKFMENAAETATAPQSISPYFESLFGGWRPDADLVREVMESMETRSIQEVFDAILKTPIAESQFGKAWGWVPVDNFMQLTTFEKAQRIIWDTPVETLKSRHPPPKGGGLCFVAVSVFNKRLTSAPQWDPSSPFNQS